MAIYWASITSSGMRIRIRRDPVIFGPPDPNPVIFSTDPDPTCNNGLYNYFHLEQNIDQNQQIQA